MSWHPRAIKGGGGRVIYEIKNKKDQEGNNFLQSVTTADGGWSGREGGHLDETGVPLGLDQARPPERLI